MNYRYNYEAYAKYVKYLVSQNKRPSTKSEYKKLRLKDKTICQYEFHHILPKCLGGDESLDNYIPLTWREHFLAHFLLCKIYKNTQHYYKMLVSFKRACKNTDGIRYMNSRIFEKLKFEFNKQMSERMKGNTWGFTKFKPTLTKEQIEKRTEKLKGKKRSEEQKQFIRERTKIAMSKPEVKLKLSLRKRPWNVTKQAKAIRCVETNVFYRSVNEALADKSNGNVQGSLASGKQNKKGKTFVYVTKFE